MDAFRSINPQNIMNHSEPRCTTSNEGVLKKPQRDALMRGLNRLFYSMVISSRTHDTSEIFMLSNLHKPQWYHPLITNEKVEEQERESLEMIKGLNQMISLYVKQIPKGIQEEDKMQFVGKKDAKQDLNERIEILQDKTLM